MSPRERERRSDHPGNQHVIPMVTVIEVLCTGMDQLGRHETAYHTQIVARDALYRK
jgi:hypothetical protein